MRYSSEQSGDRHDVVGRGSRRAVLLDEAVVEHDAVVGGKDGVGNVFPRAALPPFFADGRREVGWVLVPRVTWRPSMGTYQRLRSAL